MTSNLLKFLLALTLMVVSPSTNVTHQGIFHSTVWHDHASLLHDQEEQKACVLEALVLESFGEPLEGITAVASVISNRVKAKGYPSDYCAVIKQPFQFSYRNNLSPTKRISLEKYEGEKLEKVRVIARKVVERSLEKNLPENVLHYAHKKVKNKWTKKKNVYAVIGNHVFYN